MADQLPASALPPGQSRVPFAQDRFPVGAGGHLRRRSCARHVRAKPVLAHGRQPAQQDRGLGQACEFPARCRPGPLPEGRGLPDLAGGQDALRSPDQLHGFEQRLTTQIYPADFGWTPDWRHPGVRPDWYHYTCCRCSRRSLLPARTSWISTTRWLRRPAPPLRPGPEAPTRGPFFTTVSWTHPHDPTPLCPGSWTATGRTTSPCLRTRRRTYPWTRIRPGCGRSATGAPPAHRRARPPGPPRYFANISYVDEQVGAVLWTCWRSTGQDRETIVIFTATTATCLGERGPLVHEDGTGCEDSCRVPLVMRGPGLGAGTAGSQGPVSSLTLLPTPARVLARDGGRFQPGHPHRRGEPGAELGGAIRADRPWPGEYCGEGALARPIDAPARPLEMGRHPQ